MEQNIELRQLTNQVEVVGKLKSKDLEVKTSRAGNQYIGGKITVACKDGDKLNEISIKIMVMATSKLYKGIETVMKEYKPMDEVGEEAADRIKVTGEMTLNEYYNKDGKLVQFNEVKGVFYNRVEDNIADRAIAAIETVVESFVPKLDSEGLPTGDFSVNGFTVAWGSTVVELKNAIVKAELAEAFQNLYQPGNTGKLTFKINNYVLVEEKQEEVQSASHGFGSTDTIEDSIIKNYVNNLEIIGGDVPHMGAKEYTAEDIQNAKKVRELKLSTLSQPAPDTPPTGFPMPNGNDTKSKQTTSFDDTIPDF